MFRNILTNHEKGRPVLIGTTSVEESEEIVQALGDLNVKCEVLACLLFWPHKCELDVSNSV